MGSPGIAPPDGYELDDTPNAMRAGLGRLALSPAKLVDVARAVKAAPGAIGNAMASIFGQIKEAESDPRPPSQMEDRELGERAMLGPQVLLPAFGRALGGAGMAAEIGAAGGKAAKAVWTPTMVRKLVELDKQFASETGRGVKTQRIVDNFREFYKDHTGTEYPGSDQAIGTMVSRAKAWGGVNEVTGAAEASGKESGSELGVFGGRVAARNMMAAGRESPTKVLDMAEKLEASGFNYDATRRTINQWIERNDPTLGGVTQGADGKWRFEISDKNAKLTPEMHDAFVNGELHKRDFTVGEGLDHPGLLQMHPDIANMEMRVHKTDKPMQSGYHQGAIGRSPELEAIAGTDYGRISATADTPEGIRSIALHEAGGHAVQGREGFARGAAAKGSGYVGLEDASDIISSWQGKGSLTKHIADLQATGKLPLEYGTPRAIADRVNYWRSAGESEARLVQDRAHMSPAELRKVDPKLMQSIPENLQIVRGVEGPESAITTQDINRIAGELGLDAKTKLTGGGTTYTKIRDPAGAEGGMEVRVPSPNDPHAGRSKSWNIDTSIEGKRDPTLSQMNLAGEPYDNNLPAVRDRLEYTFGKQRPETPAAQPEPLPPDPRQLKLLSGGLPPGFVLDDDRRNAMVPQ